MDRGEFLEKAGELISGERAQDYGDAKENFARIAVGWNIIAKTAIEDGGVITARHVAMMMDWMKTCRLLNTPNHIDSWLDKIGYSALGGEIASFVSATSGSEMATGGEHE